MGFPPRVLLLGGHGKVSQLFTRIALARSWHLTSVIRDPAQKPAIIALGSSQPGNLEVLVSNVEEVKTESQAQDVISSTKPDYIVWSAGAGGKGGPERTDAIDHVACIAFIQAAAATNSVSKFLLVSYLGSRRSKASWWREDDWQRVQSVNDGVLKNYYPAKLAADECLTAIGRKRGSGFAAICLRPGSLSDEEDESLVSLGKTQGSGKIRRIDVARVAAELLEAQNITSTWLDLLEGQETVKNAVKRCVDDGVDSIEGEDVEDMKKRWSL